MKSSRRNINIINVYTMCINESMRKVLIVMKVIIFLLILIHTVMWKVMKVIFLLIMKKK